jgi:hypothetical protein
MGAQAGTGVCKAFSHTINRKQCCGRVVPRMILYRLCIWYASTRKSAGASGKGVWDSIEQC